MRRALAALALALAAPAAAFAATTAPPSDPLAPQQWYLAQNRVFDAWPAEPLAPVRVAVIDSGIDGTHPEFVGKIAGARSFVGGSPLVDRHGHGTFVAGEIAAAWNNEGIAGLAPPAQLLVAKVVRPDGSIGIPAEARAIRWAVDNGARVINLSLTGVRHPRDSSVDSYSRAEAEAIAYAVRRNVVVVAAVGNSGDVPGVEGSWNYAGYPAALPHVLGVSAFARDGSVPSFSNRDARFNDLAAPGVEIVSTFPRALTARIPSCAEQGYSPCAPPSYRSGTGTSFAAAQVSAAAALLLAARPALRAEQVTAILERSASDARPETGCAPCRAGRDALTGWGRLDVAAAMLLSREWSGRRDRLEPNDQVSVRAPLLFGAGVPSATLDYWDDATDVYRVRRRSGEYVTAALSLGQPVEATVRLRVLGRAGRVLAATTVAPRRHRAEVSYRVRRAGWHYVRVDAVTAGRATYALRVERDGR